MDVVKELKHGKKGGNQGLNGIGLHPRLAIENIELQILPSYTSKDISEIFHKSIADKHSPPPTRHITFFVFTFEPLLENVNSLQTTTFLAS